MRHKIAALLLAAVLLPVQECVEAEESALFSPQELLTYENTSVGGSLAHLGVGECRYAVTAEPVKGSLCLLEDGSSVYTPREGKLGRDSFYYLCSDGSGELSREICVRIRIESQTGGVHYEDMRGRGEAFAAARLSEAGLFTGEQLLGRYCFHPDRVVTRGEFLSICLRLSGRPILGPVQSTGFPDDEAIPVWLKSYVLSASVQGIGVDREECFAAEEPISRGEAADIAEELLGLRWDAAEPEANLDRAAMARLLLDCLPG